MTEKKSLARKKIFRVQLHYFLVVVVVSDVSDIKVISSAAAVIIFAVN